MNPTANDFRRLCQSREWKAAVNAYLMQRTMAETMRERVNAVHREILTECPIYDDDGQQILDSGRLYLSADDAACEDFYAEADRRLKALGIKPASMENDYCPALVEESNLVKVEWLLINDIAGPHFGVDNDRLLCAGMDKRKEFISLIVGAVVSSPGFKAPTLTGKVTR